MSKPISDNHRAMYMRIAHAVAITGTCDRLNVGAVIVRSGAVIATGYNGAAAGARQCNQAGHLMVGDHCHRSVHAEANAIINAAKSGASTLGATMFVTHRPCYNCLKHVINAGIATVYYHSAYGDINQDYKDLVSDSGIKLEIMAGGDHIPSKRYCEYWAGFAGEDIKCLKTKENGGNGRCPINTMLTDDGCRYTYE